MPDRAASVLECPYVGLQPYAEEHRKYFFGRDRERRIIAANLYAAPLSVLYGASGVGKSSILQAGVAGDLRRASRTAVVYFNEWHDDSFLQRLKRQCLDAVAAAGGQTAGIDPAAPLDQLLAKLQESFRGNVLILLDQFEEYFLYHPEEETAHTFDAELARTVNRDDLQANILIALRDDWLARLDRFRARIPNLLGNTIRLANLDKAAAEEAIRKPLVVWNEQHPGAGASIEDPLVEAVVRDVRTGRLSLSESAGVGEAKGLGGRDEIETAFLQLVLIKLWDAERQAGSSTLRLATYERLGGASEIVQTHLNDLLDHLTEEGRESCARMFPYLVTPGGSKIAHETRDLVAFAGRPREETVSLLETLDGQRVLRRIAQPERYEIFHDILAPAILDWRARYVQAREQAQRRAEEQLRAEIRSARKQRALAWMSLALALLALGAAWIAYRQRTSAIDAAKKEREAIVRAQNTRTLLEVQKAQSQTRLADLQRRLAEQARLKAEEQSRTVSALKDEAEQQAELAKTSEHIAQVRLALAGAHRLKDEDLRERESGNEDEAVGEPGSISRDLQTAIQLALAALKSSDAVTRAEAEDALRQIAPPLLSTQLPLPLHILPVKRIVFSPDGKTLATADGARIKLWVIPERRELLSLKSAKTDLHFSSDGRYFAAGGPDGVFVHEVSGEPKLLFDAKMTESGPERTPRAAATAFRAQGREIAFTHSASGDETWTLKVWETATGKPLVDRGDLPGAVQRFAFSGDGNRLATVSSNTILGWDVTQASEVWKLTLDAPPQESLVALNEDGTRVAAPLESGVAVWFGPDGPEGLPWLGEDSGPITSLLFRPDGKLQTTGGRGDLLWEPQAGSKLVPQTLPAGVQASPYGEYRALFTADDIHVYLEGKDLGGTRFSVSGPLRMRTAGFSGNGRLLVTGDGDGTIRVWDVQARSLGNVQLGASPRIVALSRDGHLVAAVMEGKLLEIWEWSARRRICGARRPEVEIVGMAFSPDGTRLGTRDYLGGAVVWDLACSPASSWEQIKTRGFMFNGFGLDFSPDGRRLAMSGQSVTIRNERSDITVLPGIGHERSWTSGIAWNPDTSQVATEDRLWHRTADGKWKMTRLNITGSAPIGSRRVAFSPDGRFLATPGRTGGTINLWDRTGKRVASLYGHDGTVLSLAFSEDGTEVLVITNKWKLYRHPVRIEDLVAQARKKVPQSLGPKECAEALRLGHCPGFLLQ